MDTNAKESKISLQIKVLCEVEKMWIIYDRDNSGTVDYEEIVDYLKEISEQELNLTDQ